MPSLRDALIARESQARVKFGADCVREQKIFAVDRLRILGCGEQRRQHNAVRVYAARVVLVIEIQCVGSGAVSKRRSRRRIAAFADEAGSRTRVFPFGKPPIQLADARCARSPANDAERIQQKKLELSHDRGWQVRVAPRRNALA